MFDLLNASSDTLWKIVNTSWIVTLLIWLCARSHSPHIVLSRIWRLVQGKAQRTDPIVGRWLEQRDALVQFRVMSGTRARTLNNVHRLIAWAEANNEDIADIARCKTNFDLESVMLKRTPSRFEFTFVGILLALSIPTLVLSAACTLAPRVWVSVKTPDAHTLFLSETDVRVWRSTEHFGVTQCNAMTPGALALDVGLSVTEVITACGWLKDPKLSEYLDKALITQRTGLGWLAVLGALYAWIARSWLASIRAARDMAKRLTARARLTSSAGQASA
jgi:hypothetical protein